MLLFCDGRKIVVLIVTFVSLQCEGANNEFNERIRDYAAIDSANLTQIRTLQKQGIGLSGYASSAPVLNPVKFKEVPDSALSGSSHSRGLLHHDYNGYGYTDYDDPHFGHGFDYSIPDHHYGYGLHGGGHHISGHHLGYGHHLKHYDHGLAAKSLLLPIAGIALLGAAAALVTNPVLLQLGVVSGRRKRRQTDPSNFVRDSITKLSQKQNDGQQKELSQNKMIKKRVLRKTDLRKDNNLEQPKQIIRKPKYIQSTYSLSNYEDSERNFVPIPLKFKSS